MTVNIHQEPAAGLAMEVIDRLRDEGFIAYFAGGCVRDALLDMHPKDFDVATDATPESVRRLFGHSRTLPIGMAFGVINVLPPRARRHAFPPVEVATFRSDGTYSDGRRPDSVAFGDPRADAVRRDFTINGLFFDPVAARVIDFVGGQEDLDQGLIRAIGHADERIEEDKLRMLRAVRFAARFRFRLEKVTAEAIVRHAPQIGQTSGERIGQEIRRMLSHETGPSAIRLLGKLRLAETLMPDCLADRVADPALGQLLHALPVPRFVTGLAAMLTWACPEERRQALQQLSHRWRLAGDEQRVIAAAMADYRHLLEADRLPWSVIQPVLAGRDAAATLELATAWQRAFPETAGPVGVAFAHERLQWPRERLDPPPLIDGKDLQAMGWKPGPAFRHILATVRAEQLDGQLHDAAEAQRRGQEVAEQLAAGPATD